ncbi:hypothetical protein T08_5218 [Trichinella sp. T8]|nr:hypothetical protein T08_5218 [Trichinella sp. T8]
MLQIIKIKEICIILLYYVCAITDGKLGCSSGGKVHQMLKKKKLDSTTISSIFNNRSVSTMFTYVPLRFSLLVYFIFRCTVEKPN